ncbi:EF-hand domain-containing protein [uncultured Sphingomonas sp.]|uniref:EF-hand domain-containing protein n=1 Tax=uncultured Sphingomonas sp. TaxID=158754 RepID=UPI0035CC05B3
MNRALIAAALAGTGFAGAVFIQPCLAAQTAGPRGDADGDGVTTRADALAQADARFDRMDADKNGKLSADEMRPPRPMAGDPMASPPPPPSPGPGMGAGRGQIGERMFARLDANGDGAIDRGEFREQAGRRFDRLDANRDGKVDAAERAAARDAAQDRMGRLRDREGAGAPGGAVPPPPPAAAPNTGQ